MDNAAFIEAMSNLGEGLLFTLGALAILAWVAVKAIPIFKARSERKGEIEAERMRAETEIEAERMRAEIEIARAREERKAKEEERLAQRDLERSEMEGRWLGQYERATEVQQQTNVVMEGVREQMMVQNTMLSDSKERSHELAIKVDEIHKEVVKD